jgi:hypothetical protein
VGWRLVVLWLLGGWVCWLLSLVVAQNRMLIHAMHVCWIVSALVCLANARLRWRQSRRESTVEPQPRQVLPGCTCIPNALFDAGDCPHHRDSMNA